MKVILGTLGAVALIGAIGSLTAPPVAPATSVAPATEVAPPSSASTSPEPTRTAQTPNIAAEVASDEDKFHRLTDMAKAQVTAILKDPDSAKYRHVVAVSVPKAHGMVQFCGSVNARNGFGGYNGYTRFIAAPSVGAWTEHSRGIQFHSVWRELCQDRYVIKEAYGFY